MGETGGGEVLIIPQQGMFLDSYSHGAGWGGQAADLHRVIRASSPTPMF